MQFKTNIRHNAADEAGLLAWLTYIRDNVTGTIIDGSVESNSLFCNVTILNDTIQAAVATIQGFQNEFTDIQYGLAVVVP